MGPSNRIGENGSQNRVGLPWRVTRKKRARPGDSVGAVQAIFGFVGKERVIGIESSRGEAAGGGEIHPQVALGAEGDEEWLKLIVAGDAIHLLSVEREEAFESRKLVARCEYLKRNTHGNTVKLGNPCGSAKQ